MFKDNIKFNESFRYSVNLRLDLNDHKKIENFIMTNTSKDLLENMMSNIYSSNSKPIMFIGPYGKGKSHLLLLLSNIIGNNCICDDILPKSIVELKRDNKKYLTIAVNGSFKALSNELTLALKDKLKEIGLSEAPFESNFCSALKLLDKWVESEVTFNLIREILAKNKLTFDGFKDNLERHSEEAYRIFKFLHKSIMFGQEFEPLISEDISKIYEEVCVYIQEKTEYEGILLVIDEFSKFMESGYASDYSADIQNLAELTTLNSFNLICVSHKKLSSYNEGFNKAKADQWKKIEGRFENIFFGLYEDKSYYYELISKAIKKENLDEAKLINQSGKLFDDLRFTFERLGVSKNLVTHGAFPLNPYAVFSLISLSEKIAQNERSLFTFLCGNQRFGLRSIINKSDKSLVSIEKLYDYFEEIFKDQGTDSKISYYYKKSIESLSKCRNTKDRKFIKALTIIKMVQNDNDIMPTKGSISRALNHINIDDSFDYFVNQGLIIDKKTTGTIAFISAAGYNLTNEIHLMNEKHFSNLTISEITQDNRFSRYAIPKSYNYKESIVRFAKYVIIEDEKIMNENFSLSQYVSNFQSDAYIVLINREKYSASEIEQVIRLNTDKRFLFKIVEISMDSIQDIRNYYSCMNLIEKNRKTRDYPLATLDMLRDDYLKKVSQMLNDVISVYDSEYYYLQEKIENIGSINSLEKFLSQVMYDLYPKFSKMNYEIVNKHVISAQAKKARDYCFNYILFGSRNEMLRKTSAEEMMLETCVMRTFLLNNDDEKVDRIKSFIKDFLLSNDRKGKILDLFELLIAPPFGLRKGVIPFYIAAAISNDIKYSYLLLNNKELAIDKYNFSKAMNEPDLYTLVLNQNQKDEEKYLTELQDLFGTRISDDSVDIYRGTYNVIRNYISTLPRATTQLLKSDIHNKEEVTHMKALITEFGKYEYNPYEVLIEKLPRKYFKVDEPINSIEDIKRTKILLDNHIKQYKELIQREITQKFETKKSLLNYFRELKRNHLDGNTNNTIDNKIMSLCEVLDDTNEDKFFDQFTRTITSVHYWDWTKDTEDYFFVQSNQLLENINKLMHPNEYRQNGIEINITSGEEKYKSSLSQNMIDNDCSLIMGEIDDLFLDYDYGDEEQKAILCNMLMKKIEGGNI